MSHLRKYEIEDYDFSELDPDLLHHPLVYFLKLPNGFIKVGKSKFDHNFHQRWDAAGRRYGSADPLGVELCESCDAAYRKEEHLKKEFGYKDELLYDTPALRDYIEQHCEIEISYVIAMCHAAERERNRKRERNKRGTLNHE